MSLLYAIAKVREPKFWAAVNKTDSCWEWTKSVNNKGYGKFFVTKRPCKGCSRGLMYAHRFSWLLAHGDLPPDGMVLCHSCDNPKCVRPDHLFLGTLADNAKDSASKGRAWFQRYPEKVRRGDRHPKRLNPALIQCGSQQPRAKLTEQDIPFIKHWHSDGHLVSEIAQVFSVSETAIRRVVKGQGWTHV